MVARWRNGGPLYLMATPGDKFEEALAAQGLLARRMCDVNSLMRIVLGRRTHLATGTLEQRFWWLVGRVTLIRHVGWWGCGLHFCHLLGFLFRKGRAYLISFGSFESEVVATSSGLKRYCIKAGNTMFPVTVILICLHLIGYQNIPDSDPTPSRSNSRSGWWFPPLLLPSEPHDRTVAQAPRSIPLNAFAAKLAPPHHNLQKNKKKKKNLLYFI